QAGNGITVGAGAHLSAGSLVGNPGFGPLQQSQINRQGSIVIQAQSSGSLILQGAAAFTSHGADIQINTITPNTGLVIPTGTTFTANGGSISFNISAPVQVNATSAFNASLQASTLSGSSGNIQISSPNPLTFQSASVVNGLGQVQINV